MRERERERIERERLTHSFLYILESVVYLFWDLQGQQTGDNVERLARQRVGKVKLLSQGQQPRSEVRVKLLPHSIQLTVLKAAIISLSENKYRDICQAKCNLQTQNDKAVMYLYETAYGCLKKNQFTCMTEALTDTTQAITLTIH